MRNLLFSSLLVLVYLTTLVSCSLQNKFAKRIPDRIIYPNGISETGKIAKSDSVQLSLTKMDGSVKLVLWSQIDSITGHSCYTTFLSSVLGFNSIPYFSTFDYDNHRANAIGIGLKYGKMKFRHYAPFVSATLVPAKPYSLVKLGAGYSYYLIDYTKAFNLYGTGRVELNLVDNNKTPHLNTRIGVGAEYLLMDFIRIYTETDFQRNLFNKNRQLGLSINFGIRVAKEYSPYYARLRHYRRL